MNRDTRERFVLPVLVPLAILALFVGAAYALSRIMMFLPSSLVALILVVILTVVVLVVIGVLAARSEVSPMASVTTVAGVLALVLVVGAISAIAGPREELAELAEVALAEEAHFVAIDIDFLEAPEALPAGEHEFVLENQGRTRHTVVIQELDDERVVLARPGETESGTVSLEPGEYYFYCDIADHEERGMFGTLEVSG